MPEMRSPQSLGLAIGILWSIGMMQNAGNTADPVTTPPRGGSVFNARPPATGSGESFPPLLFAAEGAKKIVRYGRDGAVVWEYPAEMSRDVWQLPGGNVLFCYLFLCNAGGKVAFLEITRDKQIVWQSNSAASVFPLGHGIHRLDIPGTARK